MARQGLIAPDVAIVSQYLNEPLARGQDISAPLLSQLNSGVESR